MYKRQEQYECKNIALVSFHLSRDRSYKIKISSEVIFDTHRLILFYRKCCINNDIGLPLFRDKLNVPNYWPLKTEKIALETFFKWPIIIFID